MLARVHVVVSDEALGRRVEELLRRRDALVTNATDADGPAELSADVLIVARADLGADPAAALAGFDEGGSGPDVIVLSADEDSDDRATLLMAGAASVLWTGLPDTRLAGAMGALIRRRGAFLERRPMAAEREAFDEVASESPAMRHVLGVARRVAAVDTAVLILGETGVGKERLARAMHAAGPRGRGPFVAVNCAAMPDTLVESELFGHVRGAFTGAHQARRGQFELAHGGTFFLDEVGDLPAQTQVKLLRVLQERQIQPLGGERLIDVNVRLIAATHRDLVTEMAEGRFRQDLYYRLGVVTLVVPPLRERPEDIGGLAEMMRERFSARLGRPVRGFTDEALEALRGHAWPGNVRELMNAVERAVLLTTGPRIGLADLPELGTERRSGARGAELRVPTAEWGRRPWREVRAEALAQVEGAYLHALLRETGGRIGAAAARAGIDPRSLRTKMRRAGLDKHDYRGAAQPAASAAAISEEPTQSDLEDPTS